ncbi:MAG: hypothetical protein V4439_04315 [Patescibacteria group bacterium]
MQNFRKQKNKKNQQGFIALLATVIIGLTLLSMVAREGYAGWHARFNVLGTESKEQATALADGCIDEALLSLLGGFPYQAGTTIASPIGDCKIFPIDTATSGYATLKAQSQVNDSYSNISVAINTNDVHLGSIPSNPNSGTLIIQTLMGSGVSTKNPSDFTMRVSGISPSKTSFAGSAAGIVVYVSPGSYSITEDALSGYKENGTIDCAGTVSGGDIKSCTFTNTPVTTTFTLVANVTNKYNGSLKPSNFPLLIDGTQVVLGKANTVTTGAHTASISQSFLTQYKYNASTWGYDCAKTTYPDGTKGTVTLNTGDNLTCVVNIYDNPPPAPVCANTMIMIDRTGSMATINGSLVDLQNAGVAASSLKDLYASVNPNLPRPYLGIGSNGGLGIIDSSTASVPNNSPAGIRGFLTTTYGDLANAISEMVKDTSCNNSGGSGGDGCTNLSSAINVAASELNNPVLGPGILSANGKAKQKVLILLSDGYTTIPTGNSTEETVFLSPTSNTNDSTGTNFVNPTNAYTNTDAGASASGVMGSGNTRQRYSNFNLSYPTDATSLSGIEVDVDARAVSTTSSVTTNPNGLGNFTTWSVTGTSNKTTAVSDASNATFVNKTFSAQTFSVAGAGVPSDASIISVTVNVVAAENNGDASIQMMEENGSAQALEGTVHNLANTFTTYSWTTTTNASGGAWTASEVNNWTNKFGVYQSSAGGVALVSKLYVTVNYH